MKPFMKRGIISLLALSSFAIAPASAAVVVETHENAPNSKIIFSAVTQTQNDKDSYSWSRNADPQVQFGQSFTVASDSTMEALTIKTATLTATDAPITLSIYKVNTWSDGPQTGGEPIYTASGLLPSVQGPKPGYMTFTLDAPVALSEGAIYIFTLSYDSPSPAGLLSFYRGTEAGATSRFWTSSDGGASFSGNSKVAYLYVQGTQAIPEPSAALFLLPGIAAATLLSRMFALSPANLPQK